MQKLGLHLPLHSPRRNLYGPGSNLQAQPLNLVPWTQPTIRTSPDWRAWKPGTLLSIFQRLMRRSYLNPIY